jgi:hypothetical protein
MKTLLTLIVLLASFTVKAQNGNGALIGGSAIFAASVGYFVLGKPTQPIYSKGADGIQFYKDYTKWINRTEQFKTVSTVALAFGTVALVSGICIKTIKASNKSDVKFSSTNVTFTYKF